MRRCAVDNCTNTDLTALCHRFPRSRYFAEIWQNNLNLNQIPLDVLMTKYAICYMHFNTSDYRNSASNSLNSTAIPQVVPNNPRTGASKNKKTQQMPCEEQSRTHWSNKSDVPAVVESSTNVSDSIELLHEDTDDATELDDDNIIYTPCGSDDICILPEEQNAADSLIQSIDGAGFTILDAASCAFMNESHTFGVSEHETDLKLGSDSDSGHDFPPDSTDSDVEVLVSESVFESQASETDCSAIVLRTGFQTNTTESAVSPCISSKSDVSTKTNEVLDSEYDYLDKRQLIEIIKQQSRNIKQLEQKLDLFKTAQKTLIGHFKTFHDTVSDGNSI